MKRISLIITALVVMMVSYAQQTNHSITVAMTGDIMMGTTFPSVQLPAQEGRQLFVDAAPILQRADIVAGNLEGTLCNGGQTRKKVSNVSFAFRTPTSFAPRLKEAGYDFLSMANNHAMDFGEYGVTSTMQQLDAMGIKYSGINGYQPGVMIERNGIKYGFCAFGHNGYTLRHQDLNNVRQIITELVNTCDIVIVSFHGGAEGISKCHLPYGKEEFCGEDRGDLRKFAHFCVDAGADIVFGHGPHVTRAVELYKEHFIAYSLGNFCTPYGMSLSGILAYAPILELSITPDGRFQSGQIHSLIQMRGTGPRLDKQCRAAKEMKRLTEADIPDASIEISETGAITHRKK